MWRIRRTQRVASAALIALGVLVSGTDTFAQSRPRRPRKTTQRHNAKNSGPTVTISYPDSVSLSAFADYVSQTLDIKIIYGDEIKSQTLVFRPGEVEIPRDQLLVLLRSMLRMSDLALVEGDVSGWLRVIPTSDAHRHIRRITDQQGTADGSRSNRVVTQVIPIESRDMQDILKHVRSFLSSSKASIIEVPDKQIVIITDYESAIAKAIEIIELIDVAPITADVVTVTVDHHDAKTVADRVLQVLNEKADLEGRQAASANIAFDCSV